MASDPFADLLRRAQAGDRAALEQLFQRYEHRLLAIVRRRLGPELRKQCQSGDIQNSVLKDAFRGLGQLEASSEGALLAWFVRITENKLRNKARDAGRQKRFAGGVQPLAVQDLSDSEPIGADPIDPRPTPSSQVRRLDELDRVHAAIGALPADWRLVFELRTLRGCDWPEVASRTGLTVKAAQGRFDRARARLAALLSD